MDTAIVVFTRDLRLHDNPALHQARDRARQVVPLFVADPALDATGEAPTGPGSWPGPWPTCARPCASAAPTWCCGRASRPPR